MTARRAAVFAGLVLALLAARAYSFGDPIFWDETCYVGQARFLAAHGLERAAYHELTFLRPMLFTSLLALVARLVSPSIVALRVVTCAIAGLLLPLTFLLARRLGARPGAAWLAVGLLAASGLFLAQSGLVLSDAPTTVLVLAAWLLLLDGKSFAFAAVAALAVFTKESAYFLCAPAALLLWWRERSLLRLWPAAVPGLALFAWLGVHRLLVGVAIPHVNSSMLSPTGWPEAFYHDLVDGGRLPLSLLAGYAAWRAPAGPEATPDRDRTLRRDRTRATAAAVLALPFLFPGPLPRYMLPSLPLLCALAAPVLDGLERRRALAIAGVLAVLALGWLGDNLYSSHGLYFDRNLGYRRLLADQAAAVCSVAAARPQLVLASFPFREALASGPDDHFLPRPVPVATPPADAPLAELCRADWLIDADQGEPVPGLDRLAAAAALLPDRSFGPAGKQIRTYRVACRAKAAH